MSHIPICELSQILNLYRTPQEIYCSGIQYSVYLQLVNIPSRKPFFKRTTYSPFFAAVKKYLSFVLFSRSASLWWGGGGVEVLTAARPGCYWRQHLPEEEWTVGISGAQTTAS